MCNALNSQVKITKNIKEKYTQTQTQTQTERRDAGLFSAESSG